MKLLYDLPEKDEERLSAELLDGEKRMYCVPYDYVDDRYVHGFVVITNKLVNMAIHIRLQSQIHISFKIYTQILSTSNDIFK